jgi:phosphate transport system substrate-binding protein
VTAHQYPALIPVVAAVLLTPWMACSSAQAERAQSGRGVIRITGSDTMVNLVQAWAEHYKSIRPAVTVQVAGGGSGVGIAGLIDGTVDLAAASREMRPAERQRASAGHGVEPTEFIVALDALAVYVHKDNPLESISIQELAEIYGEDGLIAKWSQLGVHNVRCPSDTVIRIGRQNNSGTFAYFRDVVLGSAREYKMGSIDQNGSKDVVALVSKTPCAIGYSGIAFATAGVRVLTIATRTGGLAIVPAEDTVLDGSYPLARPLYFYAAAEAGTPVKEFLEWVRAPDGQHIARELGLIPVPARGWSPSLRARR